jgi:hypothetical protein
MVILPPLPKQAPVAVAHTDPGRLAHLAELRPIVLHGNRVQLGSDAAGPATPHQRPGVPVSFAIPSLNVTAPVETVSATPEGIAVPRIGRAGWFDAGPRPGEPGRAVIIGHIDGKTMPGIFEHLPEIAMGAQIAVSDNRGAVHRYRVVGKTQVPKSRFPASAVYGPSQRPVLVLVTCGGQWLGGREGYADNVLVYARAV